MASWARRDETAGSARPRRRRRRALLMALVVVALVILVHAVGGWYFSNVLRDDALDAAERRARIPLEYDLEVLDRSDDAVTISRRGAPESLLERGTWGLASASGYGQVTDVVATGEVSVTRRYEHLVGRPPAPGTMVALDEHAFPEDPLVGLGIEFDEVRYPGELGEYPAWFVPGTSETWAVVVHGNGMTRKDGLRSLPVLTAAGLPTLVIGFRNDPGAPEDPSGMLQYGATEWRDLEAAVRYALEHGARAVVLVGYSMGGGIVMAFLEESDLADRVSAVVLESPMLDFRETVEYQAADESLPVLGLPLPDSITAVALWISGWRFDLDWEALDRVSAADGLRAPVLILHGERDDDVPIATSEELARERPDLVGLVRVARAGHMETWNVDPEAFERTVAEFLARNTNP